MLNCYARYIEGGFSLVPAPHSRGPPSFEYWLTTSTNVKLLCTVHRRRFFLGTGPPFPGSAIPTVRALGLGIGLGLVIGLGLGLGLGGPWEWRTPGMADRNLFLNVWLHSSAQHALLFQW